MRRPACANRRRREGLDALAVRNGLVAHEGQRKAWATIRSGISAGLQTVYVTVGDAGARQLMQELAE
jgi:hypothetical protein